MPEPQQGPSDAARAGRSAASTPLPLPVDQLDASDPGDATQRNFRYQHAFGAILIAQSYRRILPYVSVWCEQHEDLLADRGDRTFDGWQVKTAKPENGAWRVTSGELRRSIGRFYELSVAYPNSIANFYFASNVEVDTVTPESTDQPKRSRCPGLFVDHLRHCSSVDAIEPPYRQVFDELVADVGADAERLLSVLHRVNFVRGPSRREIDAAVAHEHIGPLDGFAHLGASQLAHVKDELIHLVGDACSLRVVDGSRHVRPFDITGADNPTLMAKRLVVSDVVGGLIHQAPGMFVPPASVALSLGVARTVAAGTVLRTKAVRGHLDEEDIELLARLARAAELHLMREATRNPDAYADLESALVSAVEIEYRHAYLHAKQFGEPFGEKIFEALWDGCRRLAVTSPDRVRRQSDELLLGMVGLLADECRVWFSHRFQIGDDGVPLELAS